MVSYCEWITAFMPKQVRLLQTWNPVVGGGSG